MRLPIASLTLLILLLTPAAASAADLPLEVRGVKADRVSGKAGVEIRFSPSAKKLYKRIAGRKVTVKCATVPESGGPVLKRDDAGDGLEVLLVAPKGKRVLRLGRSARRYDTCRVQTRRIKEHQDGSSETRIVMNLWLPLTQKGAVFLDETEIAVSLGFVLEAAAGPASSDYLTAPEAIEEGNLEGVVLLADPAATPPAGKLGLYSDGAHHVAAVGVTRSGRRVFVDVNADVLSTNLSASLFSD